MTDQRDKPSRTGESVARPTARDVPHMRGAESVSEPAPQGQRPGQLTRDPTYEAELAQTGLAVLRDRTDPSTKQGGRRGRELALGQPPESVTPESPGTRPAAAVALGQSPEPPSSGGRAVASGTLLSVGAIDPRGKTERSLETPRVFFSQTDTTGQAYFKPAAIPAVTVHQTLETETVKLSDSIDPRRAKTMPRIDRVALELSSEAHPESAAPVVLSGPGSSLDLPASDADPPWNQAEYEAYPEPLPSDQDGQIHASLSPFRDQVEESFDLAGVPTRAEPLAGRRAADEAVVKGPDASAIPTHRDLPAHRIEASQPPPRVAEAGAGPDSEARGSDLPRPTTASIAAEEPERRPVWVNYLAFVAALVFAVAIGLFLTRKPQPAQVPDAARVPQPVETDVRSSPPSDRATPVEAAPVAAPEARAGVSARPAPAEAAAPAAVAPKKSPATPAPIAPAPAAAPKSAPSKTNRETIF